VRREKALVKNRTTRCVSPVLPHDPVTEGNRDFSPTKVVAAKHPSILAFRMPSFQTANPPPKGEDGRKGE
jgi:hypothetical protein